jgi:hypothetical protein
MKQALKRLIFSDGRRLRRLHGGIAKGSLMELDLAHQTQRYLGLDEREVFSSIRRLIPGCQTIVDVGANDGYYTLAFLRSEAKHVIACEPGPAVELLLRNAEANGYFPGGRLKVVPRFIGMGKNSLSVSELLAGSPGPILIKVDIEGGELELLKSAEKSDRLKDVRWLIETHSTMLEEQCIGWLEAHGYTTRIIYNARWRALLPEQRPIPHNRWLVAQ